MSVFIQTIPCFLLQVTTIFGPGLSDPATQLRLLQRLASALDAAPSADASGLRVAFGDGYGVDPLGDVWLHKDGNADAWARWVFWQIGFCVWWGVVGGGMLGQAWTQGGTSCLHMDGDAAN